MTEEIKMRIYGSEHIKMAFGERADRVEDKCLYPLLESIAELLYRDISKNSQKFGITDWRLAPKRNNIFPWFELVVEGKIVDLKVRSIDIDEKDDDKVIWSVGDVEFSGPEAQVEKIFSVVKAVAVTYDFDKLKAMAAERLKKEKVGNLGQSTRSFYGV